MFEGVDPNFLRAIMSARTMDGSPGLGMAQAAAPGAAMGLGPAAPQESPIGLRELEEEEERQRRESEEMRKTGLGALSALLGLGGTVGRMAMKPQMDYTPILQAGRDVLHSGVLKPPPIGRR